MTDATGESRRMTTASSSLTPDHLGAALRDAIAAHPEREAALQHIDALLAQADLAPTERVAQAVPEAVALFTVLMADLTPAEVASLSEATAGCEAAAEVEGFAFLRVALAAALASAFVAGALGVQSAHADAPPPPPAPTIGTHRPVDLSQILRLLQQSAADTRQADKDARQSARDAQQQQQQRAAEQMRAAAAAQLAAGIAQGGMGIAGAAMQAGAGQRSSVHPSSAQQPTQQPTKEQLLQQQQRQSEAELLKAQQLAQQLAQRQLGLLRP